MSRAHRSARALALGVVAVTGLAWPAGATAPAPAAAADAEIVARLNATRQALELPPLRWVEALSVAARDQARSLVVQARGFPSRRPELLAELPYEMGDLGRRLADAGYEVAEATATLIVGDADVGSTFDRLLRPGESLHDDFLATDLEELGVGVAPLDGVRFYVLYLARSTADRFATAVDGLEELGAVRRDLLAETNAARAGERRPPLRADPCLERVAQEYAERMLGGGFFGHTSPAGDGVLERVDAGRCRVSLAAENLAEGPTTASEVVTSWLASPSHRRNLLDPELTRVGFGLAYGRGAAGYQVLWVQLLGH